jgi:hypothetical protein
MVTAELKKWVFIFFVLVLSAYVVPYMFLSNVASVYGAFLYWNVFALVAITLIIVVTNKWRD